MNTTRRPNPSSFHPAIGSLVVVDRPRTPAIHGKTGTVVRDLGGNRYEVQIGEELHDLPNAILDPKPD